jgi:hypothetical protein
MARSSLTDKDSFFSVSSSSAEIENSGILLTEYEATAKLEASLAMTVRQLYNLLAGIFRSNKAVASSGKMDDKVMPV